MKYRLKNASNRKSTDLNNHSSAITAGVNAILPNATVNIFTDYFEILNLASKPEDTYLRNMGKEIASRDRVLNGLVKEYTSKNSDGTQGKSRQLFEGFK